MSTTQIEKPTRLNPVNIDICVQQRNAKKTLTTIAGLTDDLDLRRITKVLKKTLCCNGLVIHDPMHGNVIQLQGDHRHACAEFLINEGIVESSSVIIHGA